MVGPRPTIMNPRNMSKRTVTITSVRAFFRCVPKFSESRVGVDQINYDDTFYLFKDKGQTKFQHKVSYHPACFRLVKMQRFYIQGSDYDSFRYDPYDLPSSTVYIQALSVFISNLTNTKLCTSNGHYSREINLITISMQLFCVPPCFGLFTITSILTTEVFRKLELGTPISDL